VNPDAGFADAFAVLDGVRDLLSERWAEDAALVGKLREWLWAEGLFQSSWPRARTRTTPTTQVPRLLRLRRAHPHRAQHRALAVFRGRTLEILDAKLVLDEEVVPGQPTLAEGRIAQHLGWRHAKRAGDELIRKTVAWTWKVKLSMSLERDLFGRLREEAEKVAIKVFADNLRDLLLAAPAGKRVVMGLDPGIRTGVKVAVVSDTGKVLATATVYPHEPKPRLGRQPAHPGPPGGHPWREPDRHRQRHRQPRNRQAGGRPDQAHPGHGPGREAGEGGGQRGRRLGLLGLEFASKELPDLDVSLRGAVSIARRLQDPLAELVKIEPKSIGVGQYQHDVNQSELARTLDAVVEDCVNSVGVDLNTASAPLLARSRACPPRWPTASCAGATPTAPSATASSCWTWPAWAPRPSSRPRASCASAMATTRWTCRACTRKPTRWSRRSSPRPAGRSRS
jgi:uncharacterized protein